MKKHGTQLRLHRETLRRLTSDDLGRAAGGATVAGCYQTAGTCPVSACICLYKISVAIGCN